MVLNRTCNRRDFVKAVAATCALELVYQRGELFRIVFGNRSTNRADSRWNIRHELGNEFGVVGVVGERGPDRR